MTEEPTTKTSGLQPIARAVLHAQSDDRLVALVREGREAAFEEIVRRYRPGLVAFAAAYGPPDPEDVVQEGLVRSWDALRESTGKMHLKAWLYTIVRNRALNARRDNRPHAELPDDLHGVPQPAEIVLTNDELRRTVDAVDRLPSAQREALVRSTLEGQTHEQIAAALEATPGAVRQLIYRARLTVRHGVGALIPLPVVRALLEQGATAGEAAAATTAAGGIAAAGAGGGISLAGKAAIVAAIGVVAAGSGVAIQRASDAGGSDRPQQSKGSSGSDDAGATSEAAETSAGGAVGDDRGRSGEPGDDHGDNGGPGSDDGERSGSSGPGSGSGDSSGSGSSGRGSSNSGPGSSSDDSSSSDSSSSGHGPSGSTTTTTPTTTTTTDNSGPGSDDSGSSGPG